MKKKFGKEKNNESELWFDWLTRKLNSYKAFKEFASGKNPEAVAENFISENSNKRAKERLAEIESDLQNIAGKISKINSEL